MDQRDEKEFRAIMNKGLLFLLIIVFAFMAVSAYADSCPYCSQGYGDPMPGDESRVYAMRSAHESSCGGSSSSYGGSSGGGYDYNWQYQQQLEQQRIWEEQERIRQEQERLRILEEKRQRRLAEEKSEDDAKAERAREDWNRKKSGIKDSLKDTRSSNLRMKSEYSSGKLTMKSGYSSGKLKMKSSTQADYYKTLKTVDVPLPGDTGPVVTKQQLREEQIAETKKEVDGAMDNAAEGAKGAWAWVIEKKRDAVEWAKMRMLEETYNRIPFVSGVRSITQKGKGWYKSYKELVVGVLEGGMSGFARAVREMGSDGAYYGVEGDGFEEIGNEARERAGQMVSDEVEGKGYF